MINNLNFGGSNLTVGRIIRALLEIDSKLVQNEVIILCGTASVLLRGVDFRQTMDIDFCAMPSEQILNIISQISDNSRLFDINAPGVIGLFEDYEDRLEHIDLPTKHLIVMCLSKPDWIVSKLASPKLEDILNAKDVTLNDLLWVKENFNLYCGVAGNRAFNDLEYCIRVYTEKGDANA